MKGCKDHGHILKELVKTKHSIAEIKEVFSVCGFTLSLEFVSSEPSNLSWGISTGYISGILQAYVNVRIAKNENEYSSQIPIFFEAPEEVNEKRIEKELILAVKMAVDRLP